MSCLDKLFNFFWSFLVKTVVVTFITIDIIVVVVVAAIVDRNIRWWLHFVGSWETAGRLFKFFLSVCQLTPETYKVASIILSSSTLKIFNCLFEELSFTLVTLWLTDWLISFFFEHQKGFHLLISMPSRLISLTTAYINCLHSSTSLFLSLSFFFLAARSTEKNSISILKRRILDCNNVFLLRMNFSHCVVFLSLFQSLLYITQLVTIQVFALFVDRKWDREWIREEKRSSYN